MKDPAFLFYSSDFLSGVMDLDMLERGQYITLLCAQHQKGHLSEKTIRLLVGSCSVSVLEKFQTDSEGNFFNKRLDEEIEKRIKFTESRKNNGKLGGRPIKDNNLTITDRLSLAKPSENLPENENENKDITEKEEIEIGDNFGKTEAEILTEIFEGYKEYLTSETVRVHSGRLLNTTPETLEKLMAYFLLVNGKQMTVECKTKYAAEKYFINWAKKEANKQEALNNYNRIFKPKPKQ